MADEKKPNPTTTGEAHRNAQIAGTTPERGGDDDSTKKERDASKKSTGKENEPGHKTQGADEIVAMSDANGDADNEAAGPDERSSPGRDTSANVEPSHRTSSIDGEPQRRSAQGGETSGGVGTFGGDRSVSEPD